MSLIPFATGGARIGLGRTTSYAGRGNAITEPVMVGKRAMLPEAEVEALRLARIAGFSKDETRELVRLLMDARQALASDAEIAAIVKAQQAERLARGVPSGADAQAARSEIGKRLVAQRLERVAP